MEQEQPVTSPSPVPLVVGKPLSPFADLVVAAFEEIPPSNHERKMTVNPVVAKFATWYEKLRNAMEYREEEVILRATIERILKRRLLLGGSAKTTAEPLVRELIWARYISDNTVPESKVKEVEEGIDLYLQLRLQVLQKHRIADKVINEWTYHLMSAHLEHILNPNKEKETITNFMYQIIKNQVHIGDDTEETRNAQVYIAVRKSFARDDIAFLRYHVFTLYFGKLQHDNLNRIASEFLNGYQEILRELNYPIKEKIFSYVKKRTANFFILEDILRKNKGKIKDLLSNEVEFQQAIFATCEVRYKGISSKVRRVIIRSVFFILFSKVAFAFFVEGTYERIFYGGINWTSIIINTSIPPILMIIVGLFIRQPDADNSQRIYTYIKRILYDPEPKLGENLVIRKTPDRSKPFLTATFSILWLIAFMISFGSIVYVLRFLLHFNTISIGIFLFFLTIVSFLSYRISLIAHVYTVGEKQGLVTPLVDFLFLPVVRVGRKLTQEISRINFILLIFDFIIDAPFKLIFAFFEQWFLFLHAKRDELG